MATIRLLLFLFLCIGGIRLISSVTDANDVMATIRLLLFLFLCIGGIRLISSVTDANDAAALRSLMDQWQNTPPSWGKSDDPCGTPPQIPSWDGVSCNNSRVTALGLSAMGLIGTLSGGGIGELSELRSLDLSFNRGLTGPLSSQLGDLKKLNILILAGCGFDGSIPDELGSLVDLTFLALNSNNLTGEIPASLGSLSNLYWLDLADNQLRGLLPISSSTTPGLDLLLKAKHFHFNKNQLSGPIPSKLFSGEMVLIHALLDENNFVGHIPYTLGLVQTLEVLRLDRNFLTAQVPDSLNNLTHVNELNLANNRLSGSLPDLSGMNSLNYVDLSNNSFDPSVAPDWFTTLQSLTTLVFENGSLQGSVPLKLFSFPQIQQLKLRNNAFNDTLTMGSSISQQLQLVDLENNQISSVILGSGFPNTLILRLIGNPVCTSALANTTTYCQVHQPSTEACSTSLSNCGSKL